MRLKNKRIAFLVEEGFEDLEFWVTVMRLREEGALVTIVGTKANQTVKGKNALYATSDVAASNVKSSDFDALVVPGGWAPDKLRRETAVKQLVSEIYQQGKIIGMICHAGWVGVSANIVRGHRATGSEGIKDDLINAGAEWVDEPALRDGNLVWGRVVKDIPDFCRELVGAIEKP